MELNSVNVLGLVSRSLFIRGGVTYPPRDEVLMSLQVPTGDWKAALLRGSAADSCLRLSGLEGSPEGEDSGDLDE